MKFLLLLLFLSRLCCKDIDSYNKHSYYLILSVLVCIIVRYEIISNLTRTWNVCFESLIERTPSIRNADDSWPMGWEASCFPNEKIQVSCFPVWHTPTWLHSIPTRRLDRRENLSTGGLSSIKELSEGSVSRLFDYRVYIFHRLSTYSILYVIFQRVAQNWEDFSLVFGPTILKLTYFTNIHTNAVISQVQIYLSKTERRMKNSCPIFPSYGFTLWNRLMSARTCYTGLYNGLCINVKL